MAIAPDRMFAVNQVKAFTVHLASESAAQEPQRGLSDKQCEWTSQCFNHDGPKDRPHRMNGRRAQLRERLRRVIPDSPRPEWDDEKTKKERQN
jgi:hypothetical protein